MTVLYALAAIYAPALVFLGILMLGAPVGYQSAQVGYRNGIEPADHGEVG